MISRKRYVDSRETPIFVQLFSAAILYLIAPWLAGLVRGIPLRVVTHADGEQDGSLVHRYIQTDWTLAGRPTGVTSHYVESRARAGMYRVPRRAHRHVATVAARTRRVRGSLRIIGFDLTGTGQSSKNYPQALFPEVNDAGGDYRLEMQAEESIAALERIGVRRPHLATRILEPFIGDILAGLYQKGS